MNMLEEVGETGIKILLHLYKGRSKLTDFKRELSMGYSGIYNAVAMLLKHSLITEYNEGKARYFELTPLGKAVTVKIWEAEQLVRESKKPHSAK